eukprot:806183-Pyramimonas_sp.AAC.1
MVSKGFWRTVKDSVASSRVDRGSDHTAVRLQSTILHALRTQGERSARNGKHNKKMTKRRKWPPADVHRCASCLGNG